MLESAIYYASQGWQVFPLQPRKKEPMTHNGFYSGTIDVQQIQQWWTQSPTANIGIRTGAESGVTVIDIDGKEGRASYTEVQDIFPQTPTRVIKTPNGWHLYFQYNPQWKTKVKILDKVDIRNDGGYVVAPPSVVPDKSGEDKTYEVLKDRDVAPIPLPISPEDVIGHIRNGASPDHQTIDNDNSTWVVEAMQGVGEGKRHATATSLAGYFHGKAIPKDIVKTTLTPFAEKCTPPFDIRELYTLIDRVDRYPVAVQSVETLAEKIRDWVMHTGGRWWGLDEVDNHFGLRDAVAKENRLQIMQQLKETGVIEQHNTTNKNYRLINKQMEILDYKAPLHQQRLDIRFPLGVEDYVGLYPSNICVVAGSPDAGKTALMLNLVHLNQERYPVHYFSSEMGQPELSGRIAMFREDGVDTSAWSMTAYSRSTNFEDVIVPDAINIIDFLELTEALYIVNGILTKITNKLGSGIAIVAIQKKMGATLGRGAEFGLEKPRLYLSLDQGQMTIVKGKNWTKRNINPTNLYINYRIEDGYKFVPTSEWAWKQKYA